MVRGWKLIQFKSTLIIVAAAMLFIPVGVYMGKYGDGALIKSILGISIILFALYNLVLPKIPHLKLRLIQNRRILNNIFARKTLKVAEIPAAPIKQKEPTTVLQSPKLKNDKFAPIFGLLSGLFGGAFNITGPPIVIYGTLRKWPPQTFRVTLQFCFLLLALVVILSHISMGSYENPLVFTYFLYAFPAMLIAVPLGKRINNAITNPQDFNKYVYLLMLASGIVLLLKAVGVM